MSEEIDYIMTEPFQRGYQKAKAEFDKERVTLIQEIHDKVFYQGFETAVKRFNTLCEIEMNAHEPYKHTRPLNLERLHRVKDRMIEETEKRKAEHEHTKED